MNRTRASYAAAGRLGYQALLAKRGRKWFRRLARLGGQACARKGPAYYHQLGKTTAAKRRARRTADREATAE